MIFMVQVNRVFLIIIFFNRPQFLVNSNDVLSFSKVFNAAKENVFILLNELNTS